MFWKYLQKPRRLIFFSVLLAGLVYFTFFLIPSTLFRQPYSTVLRDRQGNLLSARIAADGQWRFPAGDRLNPRFEQCLLVFEDQYFYGHNGVNPLSVWRAFRQNSRSGKIVSGGSTLTMQLMRLSRGNPERSYGGKLLEMLMALRVELQYSKREILMAYSAHAPFGSNVVGVDAAAWRYFGRTTDKLSWAECATLAVLPNAPSLIYPGKNQERLRYKRNRLLAKLLELKVIDAETYELSIQEPLPGKPFPLPDAAPQLLDRCSQEQGKGRLYRTTIDGELQARVNDMLARHTDYLRHNEVYNACALVLDVRKNQVLAYVGNAPKLPGEAHGNDVDVINAPRSTGSLLKPYLYAFMLDEGVLLPNTLVPDIPTQIAGYTPQNYNLTYDGAVPAKRALSRSLNIPAVKLLQQYGIERFSYRLKQMGMSTINRSADNYGLSLILGGAEGKLWDMCSAYASMARSLNDAQTTSATWEKPDYLRSGQPRSQTSVTPLLSPSSVWLTFEAMAEVARPDIDAGWRRLSSSQKVAWKTGTSFGFRDGWAIGVTPDYVVGVWVGNADGEGRPGLTGIATAAPLLFEIIGTLPKTTWFPMPQKDMKRVKVCAESGYRASDICPDQRLEWIPGTSSKTTACPFHRLIFLDKTGNYRVNEACESPLDMQRKAWFVLPPVQEYFYRLKNPTYRILPPFKAGCGEQGGRSMEMLYPKQGTIVYVPVDLNGEQSRVVFELAHRVPSTTVFWHLDEQLVGTTTLIHQLALNPGKGSHTLTVTDEHGESISLTFEVLSERKQN